MRHTECLMDDCTLLTSEGLYDEECLALLRTSKSPVVTWNYSVFLEFGEHLTTENLLFQVPNAADIRTPNAILIWPKSKRLGLVLLQLLASLRINAYVLAANELGGKSLAKSASDLCQMEKIDVARRCTFWQVNWLDQPVSSFNWLSQAEGFYHQQNAFICMPGVFNFGKLDVGTALLLKNVPALRGSVLDLGCGSGVIGLSLKKAFPEIRLTTTDVDAMALRSTALNAARLGVEVDVLPSDGLAQVSGRYDFIITNPPFHTGKDTDYRFARNLFEEGKRKLTAGGRIWLVANRQLPYEGWAAEHFSRVNVVAQEQGFKVLEISA